MIVLEKTKSKVLVKELPFMKVASYRVVSPHPEKDATLFMKGLIKKSNLNFNNLRKFGTDIPVSESLQSQGLRGYEFWVCLPDNVNYIHGASLKNIPTSSYAVLRIENPTNSSFDKISNGWIELHNWVKNSDYKSALHNPNRYMLEELLKVDGIFFIDLYYPVCI